MVLRLSLLSIGMALLLACTPGVRPVNPPQSMLVPFNQVAAVGNMNLTIDTADNLQDVVVSGGDLKKLTMFVQQQQLVLQYPLSAPEMQIKIYMPHLVKITYRGKGEVRIPNIHTANLRVQIAGESLVNLTGKVKRLHATVIEKARLNAQCLYADTVYINTTGFGQAGVRNKKGLSALATDYSDIYYYQDPAGTYPYFRSSGSVLRMQGLPHCTY